MIYIPAWLFNCDERVVNNTHTRPSYSNKPHNTDDEGADADVDVDVDVDVDADVDVDGDVDLSVGEGARRTDAETGIWVVD